MGKIVEKKKKKKGRPSLLDLQKRNLKEQQELLHQHNKRHLKKLSHPHPHARNNFAPRPRDNHDSATPVRRSARRNPNPDDDDDADGDSDSGGNRREKKLKLVLRLPPGEDHEDSGGEDSSAAAAAANGNKKRRINAISDGSGIKGDKSVSGTNQSNAFQGSAKLDSGPSTPLPDKKLLVFILDRLQKKDTYGVFSDPVDSEELPDYHEVIEHPMDFGTVRKKLSGGAYSNLEHFEKDVFLICSNAMQYNAPETVYFRQARSILELAKKNFENLRQDSDDNDPEPKVVARRGRPPTKNLKKPIGRPSLEALGSEFSSDVALASGGENATFSNHDLRKGSHFSDKSSIADSGRLHGLRSINDLYSSWLADNKLERNDEFTGSSMRNNMKLVKKQVVDEESRRNTYIHPHPSASTHEPSVLKTFDAERKQLIPVGVLVEHGYARSLARFAANLGPLAWKVAAKKIERSLPGGTKFGPGWVGENDLPQSKMPHFPSHSHSVGQPSVSHHSPDPPSSSHIRISCDVVESKVAVSSEMLEGEDISGNQVSCSSTIASEMPVATTGSSASPLLTSDSPPESIAPKPELSEGSNPHSGFPVLNSSIAGIRPKSPFPARQGPTINPGMNGFNGFNLPAQIGKLSVLARPPGFNIPSQMLAKGSKINDNNNCDNKIHSDTVNISTPEDTDKVLENRSTISAGTSLPDQGNGVPVQPPPGIHPRPSWPQQKPESVPPDLNVRFQSPASPSSSRVDSTQPDLALQL